MRKLFLFVFFYYLLEKGLGLKQEEDPSPSTDFSPSYRPLRSWNSPPSDPTAPPTPPTPTRRRRNIPRPNIKGINIIEGISNDYPKYLANEEGMSLYTDTSAPEGLSTCYGDCLKFFIPAIVRLNDSIKLNEQLDDAKVGLIERNDGSNQVAYNKYALYYFKNDTAAGDIKAQGFNKTWFLLNEKGEPYKQGGNITSNSTTPSESPTGVVESSSMPSIPSGPSGQHLTVPGYASLLMVPDQYIFYFTISEKNQSFSGIQSDIDKTSRILKNIVGNIGTTPLTYLGKEMNAGDNSTLEVTHYFLTTSNDITVIEKLSAAVSGLNDQNITTVGLRLGNTISDKLYKDMKKSLFQQAVKNSFDNAFNLLGNMNYTINMQRPINSIRIDPESILKFHPYFFFDTYTTYFLFDKNSTNVVTMKVIVDYNLKNK